MYFIDQLPGDKDNLLYFDLINKKITIIKKENIPLNENLYCYDLSKFAKISESFILDIQSLYGLMGSKNEIIEELFDSKQDELFFQLKKKINAHLKSYFVSKIDLSGYSLQQLIPKDLFENFYQNKLYGIERLVKNINDFKVLEFYKKSFEVIKIVHKLSEKTIYIEEENKKKIHLNFNIFGSKNSRLSLRKNSFNVYNLKKDKRNMIVAPEDYFIVQFDFKSFQPRLAIALFGDEELKNQTKNKDDIYSYFPGNRDDIKISFLAWMFSNRKNLMFEERAGSIHSSRKKLHEESKAGQIVNCFGRPLFFTDKEEENVVFQNYISSVEVDSMLNIIKDINELTFGWKSHMIFPFHDALIFYIYKDELNYIRDIKNTMQNYLNSSLSLDMKFPVSVNFGKDFFNLKEFTNV